MDTSNKYVANGEFNDLGFYGAGVCELCGHPVRYHYGISSLSDSSKKNVGSDCIIKFGVASPFTKEAYKNLEEIRIDMVKMTLQKLSEINVEGFNPSFIIRMMNIDLIKGGYSPNQMIAIDNIAHGFKVKYDASWFKINLRTMKNKTQMLGFLKSPRLDFLKDALSSVQAEKFGFNVKPV